MNGKTKEIGKAATLTLTGGLAAFLVGLYGGDGALSIPKAEACSDGVTCFVLSCSDPSAGSKCESLSCPFGAACGSCPITCC